MQNVIKVCVLDSGLGIKEENIKNLCNAFSKVES